MYWNDNDDADDDGDGDDTEEVTANFQDDQACAFDKDFIGWINDERDINFQNMWQSKAQNLDRVWR